MKKLLLGLLLIVSFNCIIGQVYLASKAKNPHNLDSLLSIKDTLGVTTILGKNPRLLSSNDTISIPLGGYYTSSTYIPRLNINEYKPSFRIDSAYLQLIIQELERHGYTLVKLPKKQ